MARRRGRGRNRIVILLLVLAFVAFRQISLDAPADEPQDLLPPWPPAAAEESASFPLATTLAATNVYVVLDASGSMREAGCSEGRPKLEVAKEALVTFAGSLGGDVQLGLLAFDGSGVSERMALSPSDRSAFEAALSGIEPAARTPLRTAVEQAYASLLQQGRSQLGYGEYHLVVVTDGRASDGEDPTGIVERILRESPVVIHTIGFCIDDDHALNQPGRTLYRTARNQGELQAGLDAVLAESPDFGPTEF